MSIDTFSVHSFINVGDFHDKDQFLNFIHLNKVVFCINTLTLWWSMGIKVNNIIPVISEYQQCEHVTNTHILIANMIRLFIRCTKKIRYFEFSLTLMCFS